MALNVKSIFTYFETKIVSRIKNRVKTAPVEPVSSTARVEKHEEKENKDEKKESDPKKLLNI